MKLPQLHSNFLNTVEIHLEHIEGSKFDYCQRREEMWVYSAERSLVKLLTSLRSRFQPHSSFAENVLNTPSLPILENKPPNFPWLSQKENQPVSQW